ncbi:hypothetical protein AB0383_35930 [Amycolatopsis sp. NPDC051373]|uniref:hypothetical protein n=1 Tax=Amycolatopsis sp. NPDC051373 TaxID=3155801 RepID=UPI0034506860
MKFLAVSAILGLLALLVLVVRFLALLALLVLVVRFLALLALLVRALSLRVLLSRMPALARAVLAFRPRPPRHHTLVSTRHHTLRHPTALRPTQPAGNTPPQVTLVVQPSPLVPRT